MNRYITVEQAVEAVRSFLDRSDGQQVYPAAPYWVERIVDALRALPPAEPTEEEVHRVFYAVVKAINGDDNSPRDIALAAIAAMRGGR